MKREIAAHPDHAAVGESIAYHEIQFSHGILHFIIQFSEFADEQIALRIKIIEHGIGSVENCADRKQRILISPFRRLIQGIGEDRSAERHLRVFIPQAHPGISSGRRIGGVGKIDADGAYQHVRIIIDVRRIPEDADVIHKKIIMATHRQDPCVRRVGTHHKSGNNYPAHNPLHKCILHEKVLLCKYVPWLLQLQ